MGRRRSLIPEPIPDVPARPFHSRIARKAVFADEARLLLTFRDSSCEDREFGQRIGFGENLAYSLFL